jgi:hypothetical protein
LTDPELPDEYLADIGSIMKKIAVMNGENAYNIIQVHLKSPLACVRAFP